VRVKERSQWSERQHTCAHQHTEHMTRARLEQPGCAHRLLCTHARSRHLRVRRQRAEGVMRAHSKQGVTNTPRVSRGCVSPEVCPLLRGQAEGTHAPWAHRWPSPAADAPSADASAPCSRRSTPTRQLLHRGAIHPRGHGPAAVSIHSSAWVDATPAPNPKRRSQGCWHTPGVLLRESVSGQRVRDAAEAADPCGGMLRAADPCGGMLRLLLRRHEAGGGATCEGGHAPHLPRRVHPRHCRAVRLKKRTSS
jgi:hypothetical protein